MGNKVHVPINIDDKNVLKRFLTDLSNTYNSNPLNGSIEEQTDKIMSIIASNTDVSFLTNTSEITKLRADIKASIEADLETIILKNSKQVAVIAEQLGTFTDMALAASWYGLSVKAGGAVAGLEIGSLDPNISTPGDESSYFRIIADNFIVGKAYEDLTQAEKDYLAANNLPNFGTVYDTNNTPIPALSISWDSINQTYKHFFNGVVSFNNIDTGHVDTNGNTVINGGQIETESITADKINVSSLSALTADLGTVYAGIIYDSSYHTSNGLTYKMKIDLNNGRIYIK